MSVNYEVAKANFFNNNDLYITNAYRHNTRYQISVDNDLNFEEILYTPEVDCDIDARYYPVLE